jgi:hypothetical protein
MKVFLAAAAICVMAAVALAATGSCRSKLRSQVTLGVGAAKPGNVVVGFSLGASLVEQADATFT